MHDLSFDYPDAAYLLPLAGLILLLYCYLFKWKTKSLSKLGEESILRSFSFLSSRRLYYIRACLLCLTWLAAVLALMGPKGNARYRDEPGDLLREDSVDEEIVDQDEAESVLRRRKAHDWIFLIDASASMEVTDTRVERSRLDLAKEIVDELVGRLDGQSVSVYAFTSQVTTISPPTMDYLFVRLMLRRIAINEGDVAGTDLMEALEFIRLRHLKGGRTTLKTLVLLSDGGDTRLERLQGAPREQELSALMSRLSDSEEQNLRLFTVGLGSPSGTVIPGVTFEGAPVHSSLDEELLQRLSSEGRGRFYMADDFSSLAIADDILASVQLDDPFVEDETEASEGFVIERTVEELRERDLLYDDYSQFAAFAAACTFLLALCLPRGRRVHQRAS